MIPIASFVLFLLICCATVYTWSEALVTIAMVVVAGWVVVRARRARRNWDV